MKPIILIGYSTNFKSYPLFERKLHNILANLGEVEVVAIDDVNGLIQKFFGEIKSSLPRKILNRELRKQLEIITHVILFWDGTELQDFVFSVFDSKIPHRIISVKTTKVVNKDLGDPYDVYIGRGSPWGNPFPIGDNGDTREDVIEKYKKYFEDEILTDPVRVNQIQSLKGMTLGCHCKPKACHGDVIADYLNKLDE